MTLCSPAMPTTATSTMSASTSAAAGMEASGPMTQRQKRQSAGISSAEMGSTRPAISGRKVRTCSKSSSLFRRAVSARHGEAVRVERRHLQRLGTDGPRAA